LKKTTIQVFEHDKIWIENPKEFTQEHFESLLKFNENHKFKYFDIGHKSVKFKHYVGVLRVGGLTIEILPKADKNSNEDKSKWQKNLLHMLRTAGTVRTESISMANLNLQSDNLLDLYFDLFLSEVENLLHDGLIKRYRRVAENLPVLKGKLNFAKQISQNYVHQERFYTEHSTFDLEHDLHKILYKALTVLQHMNTSESRRSRIAALKADFPEMPDIVPTEDLFDNLRYTRKTEKYRNAANIAKLILLNYSPDIRSGRSDILAILFDMNLLWQDFIYALLRKNAKDDMRVFKDSTKFWKNHYLLPDIVIEKDKKTYIIDTKWKSIRSESDVSIQDIRQIFAYNEYWNAEKGILLYPKIGQTESFIENFAPNKDDSVKENHALGIFYLEISNKNEGISDSVTSVFRFLEKTVLQHT